jgi:hypothetical protein
MREIIRKWLGIKDIATRVHNHEDYITSCRESIRDIRFGPVASIRGKYSSIPLKEAVEAILQHLDCQVEYTRPEVSKVIVTKIRNVDGGV